MIFDRNNRPQDPLRTPLTCLSAANQLMNFDPVEFGRYRIQADDTLQAIASLYYGTRWVNLWPLIASANGLTNPVVLPVGTVIIIPDVSWRTL